MLREVPDYSRQGWTKRGAATIRLFQAAAAGSGLAESGNVKDILAESASQGELQKQVLAQQGYITEAGYEEQVQSYTNMAKYAQSAATASDIAAGGAILTGGIKGLAGLAALGLLF